MSRYSDINQLLEEIGPSARSASDPWTLSRDSQGTVSRDSFTPAVVADMGAPMQDVSAGIQSSEKITNADVIASSPTGGSGQGSSSSGSGILGGLFNFFPLASGIAKLFGFGGSSSPPALTPYELPPSVNFEGAMTSPNSGISSLSYGEDGLPRTSGTAQTSTMAVSSTPGSNFVNAPGEVLANIAGQPAEQGYLTNAGTSATDMVGQLGSLATGGATYPATAGTNSNDSGVMGNSALATTDSENGGGAGGVSQLMTLANSALATDSSGDTSVFNSGLMPTAGGQNSDGSSLALPPSAASTHGAGMPSDNGSSGAGSDSTASQQGQSILVQVQAMDSQSFMDHSQDIAQAVRQAMLNMNSLNDVILDL